VIRKWIVPVFLLFLFAASVEGAPKNPPGGFFGVRLGMSEESVHRLLRKVATQKKEEREAEGEGEQEVWILKRDSQFDYLLVRFDRQHQLWLITVVARKDARVRYSDLAELDGAKHTSDGRNQTYQWKVPTKGKQTGYLAIARGSDPEVLTSFSIARASRQ
jgi:hypothetical protein